MSSRSTPTRNCRATRRGMMVGTLAHPLNRPVFDRKRRPRRRRLHHSAAARRRQPAQRAAVAVRATVCRRCRASIRTRASFRMSIRICLAKVRSSAKESTTSIRSSSCCGDFPDNAILSHDLIEGAYCRSALLSDVTLYEEHPSRYAADIARRHRWMRGDWQIAAWLLAVGARRDPGSASATRSRPCRGGRSSTTCAAAWCRWRCCWCCSSPGSFRPLLAAAAADLFGCAWSCCRRCLPRLTDLLRKPVDLPLGMHLQATLQSLVEPLAARCVDARLPAVRSLHQRRRDRAHAGSHGLDASGGCWNGKPPAIRSAAPTEVSRHTFRAMAIAPAAGRRGRCWRSSLYHPRGVAVRRRRGSLLWIAVAADRLVAQPADSRSPRCDSRRVSGTFWKSCRGRRGGTSRSSSRRGRHWLPPDNIQQNPHVWWSLRAPVRRTSAWRCWPIWPPTISAIARPRSCSTRTQNTSSKRCRGWNAIGGISSTGTTRARSRLCIRAMFRRSIAAIWRRTCWCWAAAVAN